MAAAATLIPPTLLECDGYDGAVLIDLRCYIADRPNATTARGATSTGLPIQYLCLPCPGLDYNRRHEPRVVATEADLVLLRVHNNISALYRSCDSEGWITVPMSMSVDELVPLPVEVSEEDRPYHETAKTITMGGERGTVAWVDLWRGILVYDVLVEPPVIVHDIPLPVPARGNWDCLLNLAEPNYIRDVSISRHKDTIKYIEMEIWSPTKVYSKAPDSYLEWVRWKRSVTKVIPGGWKAKTWSMAISPATDGDGSFAEWQPDCQLSVKDVTMDAGSVPGHCDLLSKLSSSGSHTTPTLQKLQMAFPTISIDDDDIVYLASSTKHGIMEKMEFMIAIDVRNKTLRGVAQLDVKKRFVFFPNFYTSEICRYLSKNAGN
ncbi:uncharacterized protein LOC119279912 [Triticum dicoccoides]|uniref:uncharacterized protein LOC119279912 n=1 Tax=Triticum dicoccoides TaxID=85692 RepID=UPI00188F5403|nr:uncharacterized protein LOC119279912 [Triticum dicoccoides]